LIEALVALAVVAVSLAAIGSLMAANTRAAESIDRHLGLIETARAVETGLPDRATLVPGSLTGTIADHSWRVDVQPFRGAMVDPRLVTPWIPQAVLITVRSPTGPSIQIETVRLRHRTDGSGR
jgi:general secretion pathway protein I